MINKLTSRKFLLTVAAILAATAGLISGELDFIQYITAVVAAVASYQAGEGLADMSRGA